MTDTTVTPGFDAVTCAPGAIRVLVIVVESVLPCLMVVLESPLIAGGAHGGVTVSVNCCVAGEPVPLEAVIVLDATCPQWSVFPSSHRLWSRVTGRRAGPSRRMLVPGTRRPWP